MIFLIEYHRPTGKLISLRKDFVSPAQARRFIKDNGNEFQIFEADSVQHLMTNHPHYFQSVPEIIKSMHRAVRRKGR